MIRASGRCFRLYAHLEYVSLSHVRRLIQRPPAPINWAQQSNSVNWVCLRFRIRFLSIPIRPCDSVVLTPGISCSALTSFDVLILQVIDDRFRSGKRCCSLQQVLQFVEYFESRRIPFQVRVFHLWDASKTQLEFVN